MRIPVHIINCGSALRRSKVGQGKELPGDKVFLSRGAQKHELHHRIVPP